MVWDLLLKADPEGPTLINRAAYPHSLLVHGDLLTCVSCSTRHLMIGKNLLWCSRQFGHSVQVMLTNYGTWIDGATETDIQKIREALAAQPTAATVAEMRAPADPSKPQNNATTTPLEVGVGTTILEKS